MVALDGPSSSLWRCLTRCEVEDGHVQTFLLRGAGDGLYLHISAGLVPHQPQPRFCVLCRM